MKRLIGTLVVLVSLAAAPSPAIAHQGNPNFRSEITSITPAAAADGLEVQIENFDDNVQLVNRTGKSVVIKGYDGESYVRISPDGQVEVNLNSPAYYLNEDRFADVTVPEGAPESAEEDEGLADGLIIAVFALVAIGLLAGALYWVRHSSND
ncbi:MAG: hypothetical protein JJE13_07345 [Thermoleophilia bacterium]|nr:hypothetical protein [Thermoleophilia bacterium]